MSDKGQDRAAAAQQQATNAAVLAAVAQARERRAKARADYEAKTAALNFVKEFDTFNQALMEDPFETAATRVLQWAIRYSWREWSLFAIAVDGMPKYQVDCARELGLSPRRVSKAVAYLQQRGYLEDQPKLIIPVIAPILSGPAPDTEAPQSPAWSAFLDLWKVAHSSDFERLEVARATVMQIRKVRLSEFKKWREQEKNRDASLLEIAREVPKTDAAELKHPSPFELDSDRKEVLEKAKTAPVDGRMQFDTHHFLFTEISRMQRAYPNSEFSSVPIDETDPNHQNLVRIILEKIGTDEESLVGYLVWVNSRFKGLGSDVRGIKRERAPDRPSGPKTLGLLVSWADDYARVCGRPKRS